MQEENNNEVLSNEAPVENTEPSQEGIAAPEGDAPAEETPAEPTADQSEPSNEPNASEEAPVDAPSEATQVIDSNGNIVRTYDKETHGEGYHDLAVQFAASEAHTVKAI